MVPRAMWKSYLRTFPVQGESVYGFAVKASREPQLLSESCKGSVAASRVPSLEAPFVMIWGRAAEVFRLDVKLRRAAVMLRPVWRTAATDMVEGNYY